MRAPGEGRIPFSGPSANGIPQPGLRAARRRLIDGLSRHA